MYDQPSSQLISVICRLTDMPRSSASESDAGRATSPSTASRHVVKPAAWCARNASSLSRTELANGLAEIISRGNSRAFAWRPTSRCVAYVSISPGP
jgi:hypothetical protein